MAVDEVMADTSLKKEEDVVMKNVEEQHKEQHEAANLVLAGW